MITKYCPKSPKETLYFSCMAKAQEDAIIMAVSKYSDTKRPIVVMDAWKVMEHHGWSVVKIKIEEIQENTTEEG